MKKVCIVLLILFITATAHAGKLILSTYYPAPFGSYDRMKLVPRAALADTYCIDKPSNASMYYTENRSGKPDSVRYCLDNGLGTRGWVPYPGVWTQTHTTSDSVFLTDDTINANLKVGIGTTSPVAPLDVDGEVKIGVSTSPLVCNGTTEGALRYSEGKVQYCNSSLSWVDFGLWNASGDDIYNSNSGNVGIGTTSPGEKLDVEGRVEANWYGKVIASCKGACAGTYTFDLSGEFVGKLTLYVLSSGATRYDRHEYSYAMAYNGGVLTLLADDASSSTISSVSLTHSGHTHTVEVVVVGSAHVFRAVEMPLY